MASVTINVSGLKEMGYRMQQLSADMAGKVARQSVAAGAGVVRKAARESAPVDTGNLKSAVVMKRIRQTRLTEEYIVTARKGKTADVLAAKAGTGRLGKDAYYAKFIEFGTVKMPARPFLAPALSNNVQAATEAMRKRLDKRLRKAGV